MIMKIKSKVLIPAAGIPVAGLLMAGCGRTGEEKPKEQPNILLIMSDDMGWSDIGCYGGETNTPNLDRLAENGLRFTQFYNTARCCPTRASLMTGLYPHQAGLGWMTHDHELPGYQGEIHDSCVTIAEVLGTAGYSTYMSGKWHISMHVRPDEPKYNWPLQRGYDRFFGTIIGAGSFFDPWTLTSGNTPVVPGEDFYYTDAISDTAARFIREHEGEDPFFLYVAYTAAHWPMHALPEDIENQKGKYNRGWDEIREARYTRLKQMGLIRDNWGLSPRDPEVPAWEDEEMKEWQISLMEVYAAMTANMDHGIGRIMQALEEKKQMENTLIFFLQDNGGCAESGFISHPVSPPLDEEFPLQPMDPDELQTQMVPEYTRDGRKVRTGRGLMPGPADTYLAYGRPWANASNTPFRMYKHWVHEGGIATPLIVHWPAGFTARGELRDQPGHVIDIMATCVDVSEAVYPPEFNGRKIVPLEGKSLAPTFANRPVEREAIFWEHEGNRAIRVGDWKLVARARRNRHIGEQDKDAWELYNLKEDRSELNDLSGEYPEKTGEMKQLWERYAERVHALPWPWEEEEE